MNFRNTAAVITAAGLSSRMRVLKAMLPISGSTVIRCCVQKFLDAGCSPVVIVTGRDADRIKAHLSDLPVIFVHNEAYASTQMFESVKLGLDEVRGKCDAVFFTPCDVPLFKAETLDKLINSGKRICAPSGGAHTGHPVLIGAEFLENILTYDGECGLKGALAACGGISKIPVSDPGAFMDADTPCDYEKLLEYAGELRIPGEEECMKMLRDNGTPEKVIRHCRAVAKKADDIAAALEEKGIHLDRNLIKAAALLHDIERVRPHHAQAGADYLLSCGFPNVSRIVASHMELTDEQEKIINETSVVFLADKLIKEDREVTLKERYFGNITPEKEPFVKEKYGQAVRVYEVIRKYNTSSVTLR